MNVTTKNRSWDERPSSSRMYVYLKDMESMIGDSPGYVKWMADEDGRYLYRLSGGWIDADGTVKNAKVVKVAAPDSKFKLQEEEDAAWRVFNRQEVKLMKMAAEWGLRELGHDAKLRFSRKAGCSCGCSPGFVLDTSLRIDGRQVDIWVEGSAKELTQLDNDRILAASL